jgi:hypothetical protein
MQKYTEQVGLVGSEPAITYSLCTIWSFITQDGNYDTNICLVAYSSSLSVMMLSDFHVFA